MKTAILKTSLLVTLAVLVSACSESEGAPPAAAPAMPPTMVSVVTATPEALPVTSDLPGRIAPTRIAEVRPRVSGILVERVFEQGSMVKEGDVLYRIDPAAFAVQVDSSKATLQRAKAAQLRARQQADRQKELKDRNISSANQLEEAIALLAQADADVAVAEAGLAAAELNLQYTEVKAPIAGRIGRAIVTEGALVNGSESLATIQQLDPVYVDFTQSSGALLKLRRALEAGVLESPAPGEASVSVTLDDGTEYPNRGRLLFSEAAVDETTGQVTLRAELPNPRGDMLPGMYVRVLIEQGVEPTAIAVPQQAIQRDAGGRSQLYVVNDKNGFDVRAVSVGRTVGERVVIDDGLAGGERIIVEGFQKLRPGATVAAEEWQPKGETADLKGSASAG